jgi:hypothetical protein
MKEILLTQGKYSLVDDGDYERVSKHKWCAWWSGWAWYAERRSSGKIVYMHRFIMGAETGLEVDHKNRNGLDNRQENLRICTSSQNKHNTGQHSDNKSGYKGVCWVTRDKRWKAQIKFDGRNMSLGHYKNIIDAAKAYDAKAREVFGEFAYLNFPTDNI